MNFSKENFRVLVYYDYKRKYEVTECESRIRYAFGDEDNCPTLNEIETFYEEFKNEDKDEEKKKKKSHKKVDEDSD